jgi:hypothetical protein
MKLQHSSSPQKSIGHLFVVEAWLECSLAWRQDMSTQNVALHCVLQRACIAKHRLLSNLNDYRHSQVSAKMTLSRSLCALSALVLLAQARRLPAYRHEAFELEVRQAEPTGVSALATQAGVLTIITPSPGAVPVSVTEQSQIVTTYIPQFTLCDLPPVGFFPVTRPTTLSSNAPFRNISMTIPPGNGTCETIYKTTATMVCATTLSDLTTTYTISKCPQDVTFSTQYGYVIATPTATANLTGNSPTGTYGNGSAMITAAPSIRTLTTFFLAPWQQLTTAGPPEDVDLKVCATLANGTVNCVREYQIWETSLLTINATSTISVNFSTTIAGPSQLIVETFVANITKALVTYSMSTTMELEYVTEALTTETASRAVSTEPTVYQTKTVERAS